MRGLGANVIAFGHTADDFCESFLRNALFTGRISALPPITWSRERDFRLIRPLVYVTEDLTTQFAESLGAPVIPCGCSQRTGTVRRSLRDMFGELEKEHPHLKETLLSAMGNIETVRLLDTAFSRSRRRYAGEFAGERESADGPVRLTPLVRTALDLLESTLAVSFSHRCRADAGRRRRTGGLLALARIANVRTV